MTNKIALTSSMRSNLLSLKNTQSLLDKTQDRLSTGYKVNSAMDNPSSYFTAQALNSRADDLSTLLDSIGQAISTLEVADKGITTLQEFVEQAKSVANSARDTSNVSASVSTNIKFDLDSLRSELVTNQVNGVSNTSDITIRVGDATKLKGTTNVTEETMIGNPASPVNGLGLNAAAVGSISIDGVEYAIDGSGNIEKMETVYSYAVGAKLEIVDNTTLTAMKLRDADGNEFIADLTGVTGIAAGTSTELTVGTATSIKAIVAADGRTTWALNGNATDFSASATGAAASGSAAQANTIFVDNSGNVGKMADTIQNMIGTTKVSVSVEDSNLQIKTLDTSSVEVTGQFASVFGLDVGTTFTLNAADTAESLRQRIASIDGVTAEFDKDGHMVVKSAEGDDLVISGELGEKLGISGAATNGSNERAAYAKQFNGIMTQIDELVQDTSYKGINLLNGDNLLVNFNESRTSSLELKGVTFNSVGLGFTQAANDWIDNASIDKSLAQITKATSMLRAQASEFGQNLSTVQIREDFTQNMINNLQSGADKLTLADMNEEAANMLALQTRQQLGVNSLSMASQASQSVLRLF